MSDKAGKVCYMDARARAYSDAVIGSTPIRDNAMSPGTCAARARFNASQSCHCRRMAAEKVRLLFFAGDSSVSLLQELVHLSVELLTGSRGIIKRCKFSASFNQITVFALSERSAQKWNS